jgi:hypothetical protein
MTTATPSLHGVRKFSTASHGWSACADHDVVQQMRPQQRFGYFAAGPNPTASLILLDNRLTEGPAAGTAWQDENQSARETNSQGGDGLRYVAL